MPIMAAFYLALLSVLFFSDSDVGRAESSVIGRGRCPQKNGSQLHRNAERIQPIACKSLVFEERLRREQKKVASGNQFL